MGGCGWEGWEGVAGREVWVGGRGNGGGEVVM